ncbi:MAG: hypothetical protein JNL33_10345 [Betaproteobacteria bacterium]|nr:hypothetical protein [Betaproteobacteria bacterium]
MQLVFDGLAQPYGITPESLLVLLPLGWWGFERLVRGKRSPWWLPVVSIALFSLINGIRLWDQWRIHALAPEALRVTTGLVEESWHIESRTRDWSQKSLSYRKTVSEGFDVAGVRFKWNVGDSYSPATFSNVQDPPLEFPKRTPLEVTWFVDEATQGERRIVRLSMGNSADARGHPADPLVAIVARLGAALNADNPTGLVEITRFPFAFGAHTLERDEAPTLWAALRMPALQSCLARAVPARMAEGIGRVDCEGTVFEFHTAADGRWLFSGVPQSR